MKRLAVLCLVMMCSLVFGEEVEPQSGIFLIKTDSLGEIIWTHELEKERGTIEETLGYRIDDEQLTLSVQDLDGYLFYLELSTTIYEDSKISVTYFWNTQKSMAWGMLWEQGLAHDDCNSKRFYPESNGFRYSTADTCRGYYLSSEVKEGELRVLITPDCSGGIPVYKVPGRHRFTISPGSRAYFQSVRPTADSNFIFVGSIASVDTTVASGRNWDAWLVKTDSLGNTLWTRTYDSGENDFGSWIHPTSDSGYAVFGTTESPADDQTDAWLIKIDSEGNTVWKRTYEEAVDERTRVWGFPDADGGYLILYPLVW